MCQDRSLSHYPSNRVVVPVSGEPAVHESPVSRIRAVRWLAVCLFATLLLSTAASPSRAQDLGEPAVTAEKIADGLYVLFGSGGGQVAGNVLASIGEQGTLIVDTGFPAFIPRYRDAISEVGGGEIVFAINTHWHDDHSEGNKVLGQGRTVLIGQSRSRDMLTRHNKVNVVRTILDHPAYPAYALPSVTFDDRIALRFNGERIDLIHVASAHTTGDTVVIFRNRNVVHTGDVFLSSAYPFFDVDNGGDFDGLIRFLSRLLEEIDRETIVVPGHGQVATYEDVAGYLVMLTTVRNRVAELITDGASLAQVIAARPTAEWDSAYGDPTTYFLDRAYTSLAGN